MEPSTIYKSPHNVAVIEHLAKAQPNVIIFDECPVTERCVIKELSLSDHSTKTLRTGMAPTYISETNGILFYDFHEHEKTYSLLLARRDAPGMARKVTSAPPSRRLPNGISLELIRPVVQISADEVVLVGEDTELWIYRMSQSAPVQTGIRNCLPQAWRNLTRQLICQDWESWEVYTGLSPFFGPAAMTGSPA